MTTFADLLSDAINGTDFVIEQKPDGIEQYISKHYKGDDYYG